MRNEGKPTPDRLPRPIDELSDDEFWDLFPERKPHCARVVGQSTLGPIVRLPEDVVREMRVLTDEVGEEH